MKIVSRFTFCMLLLASAVWTSCTVPATGPTLVGPTAISLAPIATSSAGATPTQAVAATTPTEEPTPTLEATLAPTPVPTLASPTPKAELASWEPQRLDEPCEPSNTRACSVLYVLADFYDDEHVIRSRPHFERLDYATSVASNTLEEINGFHECYDFTPAYPDLLLEDVDVANYDVILFAGDDHNSTVLHDDPEAHRIARDAMEQGKVVAAAGDGPVILAKAGVLEGKMVTVVRDATFFGIADQWVDAVERHGAIFTDRSLVRDGQLVTADFVASNFVWGIIETMGEQ